MTKDLNKKRDIYFPSYNGSNDELFNSLNKVSQMVCDAFSNSENRNLLPFDDNFKCLLPEEEGHPIDDLFSEIQSLVSSSFNSVHPGSLAHLDPPPLMISIIGELIAASLNNNLLAYELSPSITILEESICRWFSNRIGFNKSSGGVVASGGTLSNLNALISARFNAGLGSDPNAVFLVSEDAHSSFIKCTRIMGLHEDNLIKVKTDDNGCMDINDLKNNINNCSFQNKNIFSIVATLGTTIRGAIDPIKEISEICSEKKIWLHVDGSIGGIYALSNFLSKNFCSLNKANSITINPQKILGITKTSSLLIVSNIESLKNTFSTGLPYISSQNDFTNRGELGIQGSRSAEVIKLWIGLRFLGLNGINDILISAIKRKNFFEDNLCFNNFDIYSGPLHIITFLPKYMNIEDSNSWTKRKRIELLKNNFMLSRPKFKNKYFLRAVFGNYNTKETHIRDLLKIINNS